MQQEMIREIEGLRARGTLVSVAMECFLVAPAGSEPEESIFTWANGMAQSALHGSRPRECHYCGSRPITSSDDVPQHQWRL